MTIGRSWVGFLLIAFTITCWCEPAKAIPPFARKYKTSCTTCHYAFPKLNGFGRAFKNNGYRYPGGDEGFVKDEPVSLGAESYEKVFPEAIWPSDIPGNIPIGVWATGQLSYYPHAKNLGGTAGQGSVPALDAPLTVGTAPSIVRENRVDKATIPTTSFDTPTDVEFLFGGTLGKTISFFGSGAFASDGTSSANYKVSYNPWPILNVTFGFVDPESSFNDPDRLTIQPYITNRLTTVSGFNLNDHQAGLEVWGAMDGIGGRGGLEYAVGVVNGVPGSTTDNNSEKDVYARVSYKFFGHPVVGGGAQETSSTSQPWRDDQITVSGFAYRGTGNYTVAFIDGSQGDFQDHYLELGGRVSIWYDRAQLNAAYMTLSDDVHHGMTNGFGHDSFRASAWYVESAYVVYPWLIPLVRYESANLAHNIANDVNGDKPQETNIILGVTLLPRANVKLVAEYFRGLDSFRKNDDALFVQLNFAM